MADEIAYLTPEAKARVEIDWMLAAAGWAVQAAGRVNLSASRGVAAQEFVLKAPHGRSDYTSVSRQFGLLETRSALRAVAEHGVLDETTPRNYVHVSLVRGSRAPEKGLAR